MRFLLDESADFPLAAHLRGLGHDVTTIAHDFPRALEDTEVLSIALNERRIPITYDRDFGELVFRRKLPHAGVIFLRLGSGRLPRKIALLNDVLNRHADQLTGFVVITEHGVRVRGQSEN